MASQAADGPGESLAAPPLQSPSLMEAATPSERVRPQDAAPPVAISSAFASALQLGGVITVDEHTDARIPTSRGTEDVLRLPPPIPFGFERPARKRPRAPQAQIPQDAMWAQQLQMWSRPSTCVCCGVDIRVPLRQVSSPSGLVDVDGSLV